MAAPIKSHPGPRSEKKKRPSPAPRPVGENLPAFRAALTGWFRREGRDLPWRHTRDPYAILVSEIMLQQTQVATVVGYYRRWLELFPTASALAAAPESAVLHAWQGLGYYSRARNLHKAAQSLVHEHGGAFPTTPEAIRALPGVGRYTAAAIATFAFDLPVAPVDANIARVLARLLDYREPVDTRAGLEFLWDTATRWQPAKDAGVYNEAMMELGALICTPRAPACAACPVRPFCQTPTPGALPVKKPRPKTVLLDEHCGWAVRRGRVLLEQQTGSRWRGLWRLPLLAAPGEGEPLVTLDYPFTHHRITLRVHPACLEQGGSRRWFALSELEGLPMPNPHRRALKQLLHRAAVRG